MSDAITSTKLEQTGEVFWTADAVWMRFEPGAWKWNERLPCLCAECKILLSLILFKFSHSILDWTALSLIFFFFFFLGGGWWWWNFGNIFRGVCGPYYLQGLHSESVLFYLLQRGQSGELEGGKEALATSVVSKCVLVHVVKFKTQQQQKKKTLSSRIKDKVVMCGNGSRSCDTPSLRQSFPKSCRQPGCDSFFLMFIVALCKSFFVISTVRKCWIPQLATHTRLKA